MFSLLLSLVPGAVLLRVNLNHGRATTLFSRTQRPPCTWFVHYIDMMSLTGAPYMPAAKFIAALAQWHKYGTQSEWVSMSRRHFAYTRAGWIYFCSAVLKQLFLFPLCFLFAQMVCQASISSVCNLILCHLRVNCWCYLSSWTGCARYAQGSRKCHPPMQFFTWNSSTPCFSVSVLFFIARFYAHGCANMMSFKIAGVY